MRAARAARGALAGAALGLATAGGWRLLAKHDERAVAADPKRWLLDPALPTPTELTVPSADGTRLAVRVYGPDGAPTVVLAHGWTCSAQYWTPQLAALAGEARLVVYDQRGHGRSEPVHGARFDADALAEDLQAVLDATLSAGERAVLVGHSMGAMTIVAWAGAHPEEVDQRVSAALLASTGVGDLVSRSLLLPAPTALAAVRELAGRALLAAPTAAGPPSPASRRGVRYVALSRQASEAEVAFCERITLACPAPVRAAFGRSLRTLDLRAAVAALTVPTVVVVGTADRLTPPVHARELVDALPDARLVELPGVGHMSTVAAAEVVNDLIRELVAARVYPEEPAWR